MFPKMTSGYDARRNYVQDSGKNFKDYLKSSNGKCFQHSELTNILNLFLWTTKEVTNSSKSVMSFSIISHVRDKKKGQKLFSPIFRT